MLNTVILMGRLVEKPELRKTADGISVTKFTIAYEKTRGTVYWIPCTAWRQTADFVTGYFDKGEMIAVAGSLKVDKYTDKDGKKRTAFEVVVDNASFCESKYKRENPEVPAPKSKDDDFEEVGTDDDLPF